MSRVEYDDSDRSFVPAFPCFALAKRLQQKLDAASIKLVMCGKAAGDSEEEPAAMMDPETDQGPPLGPSVSYPTRQPDGASRNGR